MRMLKYRYTFTGEGSFMAWMFRTARNVNYDHYKKNKNEMGQTDLSSVEHTLEDENSLENLWEKKDRLSQLNRAMKTKIALLFLSASCLLACSSDSDEGNELDSNSIIGTWSFAQLNVDDPDGEMKLANDVIGVLLAAGCDIMVSKNFPLTSTLYLSSTLMSYFRFCPIFSMSSDSKKGRNCSTISWAASLSSGTGT